MRQDDLKKLIQIASTNSSEDISYSAEESTEIYQFLDYFGFKSGDTKYQKAFVEALWLAWTRNPQLKSKFRSQMKRLIKNNEVSYFLDEESFRIDKKDMLKYIGKIMLKRNINVFKRKIKEKNKES